jgi:hypothetical protein
MPLTTELSRQNNRRNYPLIENALFDIDSVIIVFLMNFLCIIVKNQRARYRARFNLHRYIYLLKPIFQ